jgi:hypothetical protein
MEDIKIEYKKCIIIYGARTGIPSKHTKTTILFCPLNTMLIVDMSYPI